MSAVPVEPAADEPSDSVLLNYRTTRAGMDWFDAEAARLGKLLGHKVTRSDVMREAVIRYSMLPEASRKTLHPRKRKGKA